MKGEGVGLIDSFALSQDLRMGQDCHLQCLKAPSSRSWPLEKSGLVPHGQTSKGSVAWEDVALVVCFRAAGCERQLGERGPEAVPWREPLTCPMDFKVGLREVRS